MKVTQYAFFEKCFQQGLEISLPSCWKRKRFNSAMIFNSMWKSWCRGKAPKETAQCVVGTETATTSKINSRHTDQKKITTETENKNGKTHLLGNVCGPQKNTHNSLSSWPQMETGEKSTLTTCLEAKIMSAISIEIQVNQMWKILMTIPLCGSDIETPTRTYRLRASNNWRTSRTKTQGQLAREFQRVNDFAGERRSRKSAKLLFRQFVERKNWHHKCINDNNLPWDVSKLLLTRSQATWMS